ncbi:MAG: hypothetical protein JXA95_00960 [Spirochaetales bacterium]|nr:hypothetical protein [Spirochaetales bacterium]
MAEDLSQDEINQLLAAIRPDSPDEKTFPREDITIIEGDLSGKKEFPGAVLIRGSILPGSYIETEGVLTAEGGITGAEIQAAGGVNAPLFRV